MNILNGSIGGPPPVTERSRLNDFPGVIGDDIAYGIGAAANKEEKKIYQLNGIKRFIARNFGTTQEAHDFFVSIQNSKIGVINDFYTQPNKFINAAYLSLNQSLHGIQFESPQSNCNKGSTSKILLNKAEATTRARKIKSTPR